MSRPLIALLSDFGTADHYVGTMKGVMLGICPEAALVVAMAAVFTMSTTTIAARLQLVLSWLAGP